jgi:hypothetical protein
MVGDCDQPAGTVGAEAKVYGGGTVAKGVGGELVDH